MACLSRKLKRIGDVKQHINRRHLNDIIQCSTCSLTFSSSLDRDEHVNLSLCSSLASHNREKSIPERLRARAPRGMPPTAMYSDLCDILFGKQEKLLEPYLGPILLESNALLWEFWRSEKASLVQTVVKDRSAFTTSGDLSIMVFDIVEQLRVRFDQHAKSLRLGEPSSTLASTTVPNTQQEILHSGSFPMQISSYNQISDVLFESHLPATEGPHNSISLLHNEGTVMSVNDETFSNMIGSHNGISPLGQDEHHASTEIVFGPEESLSTNPEYDFSFM
ncbi:unnamed protein product [Clonostachys rosea]|uniref:C2H2-type domain-containing protein n=1 Tax=Bionectria ochroleuca TaxID=29856 RepID=A0ABY6UYA8_BIOOC|nr:unnamed protein product [Clonostachys rosea]